MGCRLPVAASCHTPDELQKAQALGCDFAVVGSVLFSGKAIVVKLAYRHNVDPLTLIKLIQAQPKRYKFEGATVFKIQVPMARAEERFNTLEALLERLAPTT